MKKNYLQPETKFVSVVSQGFLNEEPVSLPIFEGEISDEDQILINQHNLWDEDEK